MFISGLFGWKRKTKMTVASIEELTLTLHGMRGSYTYRFAHDGRASVLRGYCERYENGKASLVLDADVPCDMQTMLDLFSACGISRWDGFHGKHPRNVLDGIMFRFDAKVNGGETITADGSANFPKGYHAFVGALNEMLADENQCRSSAPNAEDDDRMQPVLGLETDPLPKDPLTADRIWKCPACGCENNSQYCGECGMPYQTNEQKT